MTSQPLFRNILILTRPGVTNFADIIKIVSVFNKKCLKTQKKSKLLEIMYQNTIYICIFWYSKIFWFPMKKCWCQQNSRSVSRDSYIFGSSLGNYNCDKLRLCRKCVTDFREGGSFCPLPHPWKVPSWIGLRKLPWSGSL